MIKILLTLTIVLIILYIATSATKLTNEGFDNQNYQEWSLENINPFKRSFYEVKNVTLSLATGNEYSAKHHFANYLGKILKHNLRFKVPFTLNSSTSAGSYDNITLVNRYDRDMGIATEFSLKRALSRQLPRWRNKDHMEDIQFVSGLFDANLMIIALDSSFGVLDLNDIANKSYNRKLTVHIGQPDSDTNAMSRHIFKLVGLVPGEDFNVSEVDTETMLSQYNNGIDIVIRLDANPNHIIKKVLETAPSHFLSILKLNNGYMNTSTPEEQKIYKDNPTIHKSVLVSNDMFRLYSSLSKTHSRNEFIPTVRTRYVLFANKRVASEHIYQVTNILQKYVNEFNKENYFNYVTGLEMSYTFLDIPYHPGALKVYTEENYRVEDSKKENCIHYRPGANCT